MIGKSNGSSNAKNRRTVVFDGVELSIPVRRVMTEDFSSGSSARKRRLIFDGVEVPTTRSRKKVASDRELHDGLDNSSNAQPMDEKPEIPSEPNYQYPPPVIPEEQYNDPAELDVHSGTSLRDLPVRWLTNFTFYSADTRTMCDLVEGTDLEKCGIEGTGSVCPAFDEDEDSDDEEAADSDANEDATVSEPVWTTIRLGPIRKTFVEYDDIESELWILTNHAWYKLLRPSIGYSDMFLSFYTPIRITQHVVSFAVDNLTEPEEQQTYDAFIEDFAGKYDQPLRRFFDPDDLSNVSIMKRVRDVVYLYFVDWSRLVESPLITHCLLLGDPNYDPSVRPPRKHGLVCEDSDDNPRRPRRRGFGKRMNYDSAAASGRFQTKTRVTNLVKRLASLYFPPRERFAVLGYPPLEEAPMSTTPQDVPIAALVSSKLGNKSCTPICTGHSRRVVAGKACCITGDSVRVRPRQGRPVYFQLALVVRLDDQARQAHVIWYISAIDIGFAVDDIVPRELFLTDACEDVLVEEIDLIVNVEQRSASEAQSRSPSASKYSCRFAYEMESSTVKDLQLNVARHPQPSSCPVCSRQTGYADDTVSLDGNEYHLHDFVLLEARSGESLCHVAQIKRIVGGSEPKVKVMLFERLHNMRDLPNRFPCDERQLFLTKTEITVRASLILRRCYVRHACELPGDELSAWLSKSINHFFVRYEFPTVQHPSWSDRIAFNPSELWQCVDCTKEHETFLCSNPRLRALDIFAGAGGLSLSMQDAGLLKVTHAIEILPSACQTIRANSPQTIVYNQCANEMLRYTADMLNEAEPCREDAPRQIHPPELLPKPPLPGDIDVILAGFPCQSHSALNMYRKEDDPRSRLMLTMLSFVHVYQPKYCVFENVPGFLEYDPGAGQEDPEHNKMGGLRLLYHALTTMSYQVRCGVLQAGNYGAPQHRQRFFLIAARSGLCLPRLPEMSHVFPSTGYCIHLHDDEKVRFTANGRVPFHAVTVEDAIGDLSIWDYHIPDSETGQVVRNKDEEQGRIVDSFVCDDDSDRWGPTETEYGREPETWYQAQCRREAALELQHITVPLSRETAERVFATNLDGDYRSLGQELWSHEIAGPGSSVVRKGLISGPFKHLSKDGHFHTTVTNIGPTAKQSAVLHPFCRRMLTVRELARSQGFPDKFFFVADGFPAPTEKGKETEAPTDIRTGPAGVKMIHRQIGNAVPWPLAQAIGVELLKADWAYRRDNAIDVTD